MSLKILITSLLISTMTQNSLFFHPGEVTVISADEDGVAYCVKSPYPAAPQSRIPLDGQSAQTIMCGSCDPNGRRSAEIKGYKLFLTDAAVLVLTEDCGLYETLHLDPRCAPRSLWVSSRPHRVYVTCSSIPKYMQVNYRFQETANFFIELLPAESDIATSVNGTFISGSRPGQNTDDYFLWLSDGALHIYAVYESSSLVPDGLSPEDLGVTGCDAFTAVFAVEQTADGKPRFLFSCATDDGTKFYEFVFDSGVPRQLQSLTGSPIASPGGEFLLVVSETRTSFKLHKTSDTSQFVNPRESFSGVIEEVRFNRPNTLILVVRGEDITLVDIRLFFSSGGVEGVARLPNSAPNCPAAGRCLPHGFVQESQDHYLVVSVKGDAYEGRVYNLNCLDLPPIIVPIQSRPETASFEISQFSNILCTPPTSTPPTSETDTPPTSETNTPPTSETDTPPTSETDTPPTSETDTPPTPETDTPPTPETHTSPTTDAHTLPSVGLQNANPGTGLSVGGKVVIGIGSSLAALLVGIVLTVAYVYRRSAIGLCGRFASIFTPAVAGPDDAGRSHPPSVSPARPIAATNSMCGSKDLLLVPNSSQQLSSCTVSIELGELEGDRRLDLAENGGRQPGDAPERTTSFARLPSQQQTVPAADECAHGRHPVIPHRN